MLGWGEIAGKGANLQSEDSFVDVRVRRGSHFKKTEVVKRLRLPLSWQANRKKTRFLGLPLFCITLLASGPILVAEGWLISGVAYELYWILITYHVVASRIARFRLGSGCVLIDRDGFSDERLGPTLIPWSQVRMVTAEKGSNSGRPSGVVVASGRPIQLTISMSSYKRYNRAYFLLPFSITKGQLYIDLDEVEDAFLVREAIRVLIGGARQGR